MKHQKIYKVKELKKPIKHFGTTYSYMLECTQDGKTEIDDWFKFETLEEAQKKCDELNEKIYLSYFDEEEIKEFYNSIDFQPLYDKINKTIGLELTYKNELVKLREGYSIEIESNENLANMFQIIKVAWKEFRVSTFGTEIYVDEESKGDLGFWCTIDYSYENISCGSNGVEILSATYTSNKGWNIILDKERNN